VSDVDRVDIMDASVDSRGATADFANLTAVSPPEAAPVKARLHVWAPVPGLATAIGSVSGDNLEITVSAEVYQNGGSVWLRAMVDGRVAQPSDVQFKSGSVNFDGVRSFTFVEEGVTGGQHLVEIQMLTGTEVLVRDRVLTVVSASPFAGSSRLAVAVAPSGPSLKATSQYQDIPGLSTVLTTEFASSVAITFSAEAWADSGRMMVRALVNGVQVGEVTFVEAGDAPRSGTRSFTFVVPSQPAGVSSVKLQWRAASGSCRIGDRTMSVSAALPGTQKVLATEHASPLALTATAWTDLTGSVIFETRDSVSNVAVTASAELLSTKGRVFFRALLDGEPAAPSDVTVIQGGSKWRATAHAFVVKNVGRGRHRVQIQARVDPQTTARFRRSTVRVLWKRRRGADFVQPYLGMAPRVRRVKLLVIGFDPVRPEHPRPSFEQIRKTFEGYPSPVVNGPMGVELGIEPGPNLRDWVQENSGGIAIISQIRYVGCRDGQWYQAPAGRQGNWYWDNLAFAQMWKDALTAADPEVDFHSYDSDRNERLTPDELAVAIVRPQNSPYGTVRSAHAALDGAPAPLEVPVLDLYLSSNPAMHLAGMSVTAHEFCHLVFGALDLYGVCPAISAGQYNIMDDGYSGTHLDPFEKMKNGLVQPWAVDLDTQATVTWALSAVEVSRQILLLHDSRHVAREYFLIENRFPGAATSPNYDGPLGTGAVVVWQIFEDANLVNGSAICPGDPRFIRKRAVLRSPGDTVDLAWADGSPVGFRVSAPLPNAELAQVRLEKL
jgi:M6 family metalloprotease-like protein